MATNDKDFSTKNGMDVGNSFITNSDVYLDSDAYISMFSSDGSKYALAVEDDGSLNTFALSPPAGFTLASNGKYYFFDVEGPSRNIDQSYAQADLLNAWVYTPLSQEDMEIYISNPILLNIYLGFKIVTPGSLSSPITIDSPNHPRYGEISSYRYFTSSEPNSSSNQYVQAYGSAGWMWRDSSGVTTVPTLFEWYPT